MTFWKAKQIAVRTEDGGFKGYTCTCGAKVLIVAEDRLGRTICKSCATEAINTIDKFFIKGDE